MSKYFSFIETLIKEKLEDEWWIYIYQLYYEKPNKIEMKQILVKAFYEQMRKADVSFLKK